MGSVNSQEEDNHQGSNGSRRPFEGSRVPDALMPSAIRFGDPMPDRPFQQPQRFAPQPLPELDELRLVLQQRVLESQRMQQQALQRIQERTDEINRQVEERNAALRAVQQSRVERIQLEVDQHLNSMMQTLNSLHLGQAPDARNTQNNPLPVVEVAPPPKSISENCSICASDFDKRSSEAAFLECAHWYHYDCINEWTRKGHHTCPECRTNLSEINRIKM